MCSVVAACALLAQDKASVDRSAEQALRQLFVSASNVHNAHLLVSYYRVGSSDYYLPDHTNDIWLGPIGQFRVETNSLSGDSSALLVSDGLSVMQDPLDDDQTITISRAGKPMYEVFQREPLAFFMAGDKAFDNFVDKDQPVKFVDAPVGDKAIELHSKDLGKIVVVYKEGSSLPTRIDMFRSFRRRDGGTESPTPTSKEFVRVMSAGNVPTSTFIVHVPKGKKIDDQRTKS